MKSITYIALALCFCSLPVAAEFRTFVNNNGQAMKAELVSHSGGKVKIRREDGKEFEVDPGIFCKQDADAIRSWMATEPAVINYKFDIEADKKVLRRETHGEGSSETSWVYEISLRNNAQDKVSQIRVQWRIFHNSWNETHMMEGDFLLEQELDFNRTLVVTSDPVTIWRNRHSRNGIKGCLVRVLDPKGNVIEDWISRDAGMKGVTWENTTPKDHCEEPQQQAIIR